MQGLSRVNFNSNPERYELFKTKIENSEEFELLKNGKVIIDKSILKKLDDSPYSIPAKIPTSKGSLALGHFAKTKEFGSNSGMSETTLNSTITELAPALAFMAGKKYSSSADIEKFMSFLENVDHQDSVVYLSDKDRQAGTQYISEFRRSSKFKEKMNNAIGVLSYLLDENKVNPIKEIYWGYRKKPTGIPTSHKGDLYIKYKNKSVLLGVSLKAGGAKTHEPKLNTYVNPILSFFGKSSDEIESILYKEVYKDLGLTEDYNKRENKKETTRILLELEKKDNAKYEDNYNKALEIIRDYVIDVFNSDFKTTINYILEAILGSPQKHSLIAVKAINTGYTILKDEEKIEKALFNTASINAVKGKTKQEFFIELLNSNKKDKLTLKMSIRTNKPKGKNKLIQGFNLAVKFNNVI